MNKKSEPSQKAAEKPRDDREDGHFVYKHGHVINKNFMLLDTLGAGTFGKVIRVYDLNVERYSALKITKNDNKYYQAACYEVKALNKLNTWDPDDKNWIIRLITHFEYRGHVCMLFNLMGPSIFDFLRNNRYLPYPMSQSVHIAWQLSNAVLFLHNHGITHTDLKPENIMFVRGTYYTTSTGKRILRNSHIRLIDLGSAVFDHEHHSSIVSTRHYRAPEVIMELDWDQSCDVWSIGCILYELYTGKTLFQTHDNKEQLAIMQRVLGDIPVRMAKRSSGIADTQYFDSEGRLDWNANSESAAYVRAKCQPLRRALRDNHPTHILYFDLMQDMLNFEPFGRITLDEAIESSLFNRLPERKRNTVM